MEPTVVLSLDLELAWGSFDQAYGPDLLETARWTHDVGMPWLLRELCRHGLSATWAMVGLAMRDRLPPVDQLTEVTSRYLKGNWFQHIPRGATEREAPEWFGASLVDLLRRAPVYQELGFHGLSHVVLSDEGTPPARVREELEGCRQLARELDLPVQSFVFPRNGVAGLDLLREHGFRIFRSPDLLPLSLPTRRGRAVGGVLADVLGTPPQVVWPVVESGLVNLPGSLMIRYLEGWRSHIPDSARLSRLLSGLQACVAEGGIFHVWFHPENLYAGRPRLQTVVSRFLEVLGAQVRQGKVRCLTMGQVADELLGPAPFDV